MNIPGATRLEIHRRLESTNQRLLEWAREGAPFFAVVVAREQTRGRGRSGSHWISAPDAGLWISVLLPPPPSGPPGVASMAVGVAAARAIESVAGVEVGLKWPNDLLIPSSPDRPEPGKVGGVLCEVATRAGSPVIVAGIGINLRRPPNVESGEAADQENGPGLENRAMGKDAHLLAGAAFLDEATGAPIGLERLAGTLVEELRSVANPPPDQADESLLVAWHERDLLEGQKVSCTAGGVGVARGVGRDGRLEMTDAQGRLRRIQGGTVRLLGEGPPALFGSGGGDKRSPEGIHL